MTGPTGPTGPAAQALPAFTPAPAVPAPPDTHPSAPAALRPARGLPVISLFFNAVFEKEMRVAGRKPATYYTRTIYAGLMLALITLFFIGFWQSGASRGSAGRAQELQTLAPILAIALVWFGFVMLTFIAPATTVPAFLDERRRRTLPALMTTPLTSGQIVAAKLLSQVIQLVILALLSLPVLLAVRVFGGVPAAFLVQSMGVVLSTGLFVASIALRFSLYRQRADAAIIAAFTTAAGIQAVPIILVSVLDLAANTGYSRLITPIVCSPYVLMVLSFEVIGGFGPTAPTWVWMGNITYNLAWAAAFAFATTASLRRVLRLEGAGIDYLKTRRRRKTKQRARKRGKATTAAPSTPADAEAPAEPETAPASTADRDSREVGDKPVLWRELRQPAFNSRTRLVLYTALVGLILLAMYGTIGFGERELHFPIIIIGMMLIFLRAAAGSTASITAERDARTWETLLTTPLSSRSVIWGKFAGTLRCQWFVPAVLLAHMLLSIAAGVIHPVVVLHVGLIITSCAVFLSATGVLLGLLIRRSTPAAVINIALALTIWMVLPMLGVIAVELFGLNNTWVSEAGQFMIASMHPLFYVVTSINGAIDGTWGPLSYETPRGGPVGFVTFTTFAAVASGGYLLAAAIALRIAEKLFPAASGRSS